MLQPTLPAARLAWLSVWLAACLSVWLSVCPAVCLSVRPFVRLPVRLSVCPPARLLACLLPTAAGHQPARARLLCLPAMRHHAQSPCTSRRTYARRTAASSLPDVWRASQQMACGCARRFPLPNELINPHAPSHALHTPASTSCRHILFRFAFHVAVARSPAAVTSSRGNRPFHDARPGRPHNSPIASALHYCVAMQSCSTAKSFPPLRPPGMHACVTR